MVLLTDLGRLVDGKGKVVCLCGQKEMERDKNQNFPTVILSFLMRERDRTVNVP